MLAGWRTPTTTIRETRASTTATTVVSPPRNDQARPSWISWARITGLRAQERPPTSPHAQISSAPPYSAKKTVVVSVTAAFPGDRLNSSATA